MRPTTYQSAFASTASEARFLLSLTGVSPSPCFQFSPLPSFPLKRRALPREHLKVKRWRDKCGADLKAKNWAAVESRIAEEFQSIHPDGPRDRAGEITLIKNLNLGEFTLSDFKATVNGENIVVTYTIAVHETINEKRLPTKPTPRLSVWKKGTHGWQWVCHANLNPIPLAFPHAIPWASGLRLRNHLLKARIVPNRDFVPRFARVPRNAPRILC
jgi:hypothetical protein